MHAGPDDDHSRHHHSSGRSQSGGAEGGEWAGLRLDDEQPGLRRGDLGGDFFFSGEFHGRI